MNKKGIEVVFAFDSLLRNYPDSEEFEALFSSFMIHAFRMKNESDEIPIADMMAVLRYRKPKIIRIMKKKDHMILNLLLHMHGDYNQASNKLQRLINENLSNSFRCS